MSANEPPLAAATSPGSILATAFALALAASVSLGLARFSYALLLPPMRESLQWSYATAGAMNTLNAAGYLVGALLAPRLMRSFGPRALMLAGSFSAAALLALHGAVNSNGLIGALRWLTGIGSAFSFVGGSLLAARLASAQPQRSGLLLGVYYGGVGLGIIAATVSVPPSLAFGQWPAAWWVLGGISAVASAFTALGTRSPLLEGATPAASAARAPSVSHTDTPMDKPAAKQVTEQLTKEAGLAAPFAWRPMTAGLAGYACFGLGYIGYMTFIISLLREQGLSGAGLSWFYALLGAGVVASSWLWARLLQRHRGGRPMAQLNALLALATALPVFSAHPMAVYVSGALFGCVFLSVVASTTALVRHNHEAAAWPAGIAAFTIVFAAGQIVGPSLVGLIADGAGGLQRGFWVSAALLALGAVLASRQRALAQSP